MMDELQQQHHVEDVGRILLQTQEQLRAMREQMTAAAAAVEAAASLRQSHGGVAVADVQAFGDILQRAELELQSKAELVLNGLVHAGSTATYNRRADSQWPTITGSLPAFPASKAQELDAAYFRSVRAFWHEYCQNCI